MVLRTPLTVQRMPSKSDYLPPCSVISLEPTAMLTFDGNLKANVALEPCHMRKSFNTLAALARNHIGLPRYLKFVESWIEIADGRSMPGNTIRLRSFRVRLVALPSLAAFLSKKSKWRIALIGWEPTHRSVALYAPSISQPIFCLPP